MIMAIPMKMGTNRQTSTIYRHTLLRRLRVGSEVKPRTSTDEFHSLDKEHPLGEFTLSVVLVLYLRMAVPA